MAISIQACKRRQLLKLVKPMKDFDFWSEDRRLQYKLVHGTLRTQVTGMANWMGEGGSFRWLTIPETRKILSENPELDMDREFFRAGTGVCYVNNTGQERPMLYLSEQNRIILSRVIVPWITPSQDDVEKLVGEAKDPASGVLAVDLESLAKNKRFVCKQEHDHEGRLEVSTADYEMQMDDDPNVAALISAGYGPKGETLDRIMHGIRQRRKAEYIEVLTPQIVKSMTARRALVCLSSFNFDGEVTEFHGRLDVYSCTFALGVREASNESGRFNKKDFYGSK